MFVQLKKSTKGFTLIEIIVVIIIVGVLASVALPRFWSVIQYAYAVEGLSMLGVIRKAIIRCGLVTNNITGCNNFAKMDIQDPGTAFGTHFSYIINITNPATKEFIITATRNSVDGGNAGDLITFTVTTTGITRSGTGNFSSMK